MRSDNTLKGGIRRLQGGTGAQYRILGNRWGEKFSADELVTLRREFGVFLKSKQKILKECGIEKTDFVVRAGIHHDMEDYLEYLESDMESEDNDDSAQRDN